MYFLNGDRIYIKPENGCHNFEAQLQSCLFQLKNINSGKKVFKLNFFVDTHSEDSYTKLREMVGQHVLELFSDKIVLSVIAQPPLTCKIIVEVFLYDYVLWKSEFIAFEFGAAMIFRRENTEVLVGNVQANLGDGCKKNAEQAFAGMGKIFQILNVPIRSVVRQWNYLEDILGFDGEKQNYQEFNNVRSQFYGDFFEHTGYPAATGIGMNRGGVIIEFVAVKSDVVKTIPVDNPGQIAAHRYSNNVLIGNNSAGKNTPKFERARYLELFDKKLIFISGTASILGEQTVGTGNPEEQTRNTIQNIQRLYSTEVLEKISKEKPEPKYGHARVYIKNRRDFPVIKKTFKTHFGNLPVVYIIADICRENLLVEIEGKVVLE